MHVTAPTALSTIGLYKQIRLCRNLISNTAIRINSMHLPRSQRKLILFLARLKELSASEKVVDGLKYELTKGGNKCFEIRHVDGMDKHFEQIEHDTLVRSATKHQARKGTAERYDKEVRWAFPQWDQNVKPVSDPEIGVFTFAKGIGYEPSKARFILDTFHASNLPTFSSMTRTWKEGERFVLEQGGLYHVYRYDLNNVTSRRDDALLGLVTKSTLSVRYPVPYRPSQSDNNRESCRVRCKLNLPGYGPNSPEIYKYDGFVSPRGGWQQWLFQSRSRNDEIQNDVLLMYSRPLPRKDGEPQNLEGMMLTQNQDRDLTPTCSKLLIVRNEDYRVTKTPLFSKSMKTDRSFGYVEDFFELSPNDERDFMRNTHAIIDISNLEHQDEADRKAINWLFASSLGHPGAHQP